MRPVIAVVVLSVLLLVGCSSASTREGQAFGGSGPASRPAESNPVENRDSDAARTTNASQATPVGATSVAARPAATSVAAGGTDARSRPEPGAGTAGGGGSGAAPQAAAQPARPAPPAPTPGPPAQPTASQPAAPAAVQPAQANRLVIYSTEIGILVRSLSESVQAMSDVATGLGGYVAGVENKEENGRPILTVRLKVPPERYDQAMRQLRGLAVEVTDEKASTQDVTEEYSDVQTQLAALEASHAQLLELLGKAQNVDEILKIQERVAQTKSQIDRLKGRQTFLQRNSELATIAVRARAADDVLARTYTTLRTSLRRAEGQRATTLAALERARTPEDEAKLRDQLAETSVEIDRATVRLRDIEEKAQRIGLTLPVAQEPALAAEPRGEDALKREYVEAVVQRRVAAFERDRLGRELRVGRTADDVDLRARLQAAILDVDRLDGRIKLLQERAKQAGATLPTLTPEQEAVLAGVPAEPSPESDVRRAARTAWEASLRALGTVAVSVVSALVFLWWAIPPAALLLYVVWRRRRVAAPGATA